MLRLYLSYRFRGTGFEHRRYLRGVGSSQGTVYALTRQLAIRRIGRGEHATRTVATLVKP